MWNHIAPCSLRSDCHDIGAFASVAIWRVDLDLDAAQIHSLERVLSDSERARARRYASALDQDRFTVRRASLRVALAESLGTSPHRLALAADAFGKPFAAEHPTACFNASHSGGVALIAITRDRQVGVDLERLRTDFDYQPLAARFFSPDEQALVSDSPKSDRHHVYLRLWTAKEACLKALGTGICASLSEFSVLPTCPSATPIVTEHSGARFHLKTLNPCDGHVATIAVEQPPSDVKTTKGDGAIRYPSLS